MSTHTHTHTRALSHYVSGSTHVHLMSSNSTSPQQRHQALPQGSPSLRSPYTLIVLPNRGQGSNSLCVFVILSVRLGLQSCLLFSWQSYIVKVVYWICCCRWEFLSLNTSPLISCSSYLSTAWGRWVHLHLYLLLALHNPGSITILV